MPPRGDMAMDDPIDTRAQRPRSGSAGKNKHRSKDKRREKSDGRREKQQPQDGDERRRSGEDRKSKGRGDKEKRKSKKKPASQHNEGGPAPVERKPSTSNRGNNNQQRLNEEGVTVSDFMARQREMQDEASNRKNNTLRQRMIREHMMANNPSALAEDGERTHYFDDDDSDYDERERAVVARDNSQPNNQQSSSQVVDAVPADHPSSQIIQKYRTCSLCHRTLPRSQFSERDRYSVNLSLAPGATCRTCAMTVCAVRLKTMPGTEQLLLEYAQRGMQQGLLAMEANNGGGPIAGYLEGGEAENRMVVRKDSQFSTGSGITGKELTLYGGPMGNSMNNGAMGNGNGGNVMGMQPKDVNSTFNGSPYAHTDADRPTQVADCKYIDALLRMPCYLNLNAFGLFTSSKEVSVSLAALEAVRLYGTLEGGYFTPHDCDGQPAPERKPRGKRNSQVTDEAVNGSKTDVDSKDVVCLVLNEGPTPRTAILASQHYGWTTLAIDPNLAEEWDGYHDDIPGFTGYSGSIGDFMDNGGEFAQSMIEFRRQSVQHLVIIGVQHEKDSLRLKGNGHINEIRNRYDDVPTTLVSLSPVRKATLAPQRRMGQCGSKLEKDVGYDPNCSYIDEGVFSECRMVEVWNFHNADDDDEDGEYTDEDGGYNGGGFNRQESTESDYAKNKVQQQQRAPQKHDKFGDEPKRPSPKQAKKESAKKLDKKERSKKKKGKKNNWLEKQVAQHTEKKAHEHHMQQEVEVKTTGTIESMSTMGTKELVERQESNEYVRNEERHESPIPEEESANDQNEEEGNANNNDDVPAEMWSPPDEEVANQVWEKALAKHGQQESFCNEFEEYYGHQDGQNQNGHHQQEVQQHQEDYGHDGQLEHQDAYNPDDPQQGLPPGWEAIHDPASGDYYYTNWETGEVTWDRPGGYPDEFNREDPNAPMSPSENSGAEDNNETNPFMDDQKPASDGSGNSENDGISPLVQYNNHGRNQNSFDDVTSDNDSHYVFDDQSSASSGIAALSRWNKPVSSSPSPTLGKSANSGATQEIEDDMIVWSDDENEEAKDKVPSIERSASSSSQRAQPWHRKDSADGNNDSFIYD